MEEDKYGMVAKYIWTIVPPPYVPADGGYMVIYIQYIFFKDNNEKYIICFKKMIISNKNEKLIEYFTNKILFLIFSPYLHIFFLNIIFFHMM